jgi:hypothetical protein
VRVILHPDARAELRSAVLWYDEQREDLGTEFLIEVASALDRISARRSLHAGQASTTDYAPFADTRCIGFGTCTF